MKVAVYGTLRQGCGNHYLLQDSTPLGRALLQEPATMFSNGGFPILSFAVAKAEAQVVAELYDVDDPRVMARLDQLEGYPGWYDRTEREFLMEDGSTMTAWVYHQDRDFTGRLNVVENGDWVETYRRRA